MINNSLYVLFCDEKPVCITSDCEATILDLMAMPAGAADDCELVELLIDPRLDFDGQGGVIVAKEQQQGGCAEPGGAREARPPGPRVTLL
jgi:hypothetical protein